MCPPPPSQLRVLQMRGQAWGWPDAPLRALGWEELHRPVSGSAGRSRSISSAPYLTEPLPSMGTRLPSPAPHLFQLPALPLLTAASAPAGSARLSLSSLRLPKPTSAPLLSWPAPQLPPSFPPPSTGSRDRDRSCAAHPHPQPGILPTSTIAR